MTCICAWQRSRDQSCSFSRIYSLFFVVFLFLLYLIVIVLYHACLLFLFLLFFAGLRFIFAYPAIFCLASGFCTNLFQIEKKNEQTHVVVVLPLIYNIYLYPCKWCSHWPHFTIQHNACIGLQCSEVSLFTAKLSMTP